MNDTDILYMSLLQSDEIKIKILKELKKSDNALTLNGIRKRIGAVNYVSVKRSCEFLELFGLIKVEQKFIENKKYNFIILSKKGQTLVEEIKNVSTNLK